MVIPIDQYQEIKQKEFPNKKVVCTSGFFDPIHPGHISCLLESKKFGEVFVVILDGDQISKTKKGKPFIPENDRAEIVDAIKGVDYVVIYNHPTDYSILGGLEIVRPDVFTKGGDRDPQNAQDPNSPLYKELKFLESYGATVEYGVGKDKVWSSSNYLQEWVDFVNSKEN